MAILRLWSGLKFNNRGVLMYDFTFWLPEVLIFSCLEIDFAIICASMPIFWPTVMAAWSQIYVTKELIVTVEHHDNGSKGDLEMSRTASRKSDESTETLVTNKSVEGRSLPVQPLKETLRMSWGGTALK
jgi:hypothetical protein